MSLDALTSETRRWAYTGDGVATDFAYSNYVTTAADLAVYLELIASPYTLSPQTLTTHYSVTGVGTVAGGNVVFVTPPSATHKVVIVSRIPGTQPSVLPARQSLPNDALTAAYHRIAALAQQLEAERAQSPFRMALGDTAAPAELPAWRTFVNALVGVDASGNVVPSGGTGSVPISPAMTPVVQATTLAAARIAMAVAGVADVNTFTQRQTWAKGADIASAATLVLGTDGNFFHVTGTTGITAITVPAGTPFTLVFDGALTLTHHATNLILPGGNDIVTAAGDRLSAFAEAANQVRVVDYVAAAGISFAAGNNTLRTDVTGDNTAFDIPFDTEFYDLSGNYNNSTGVFTAPRKGIYFFASSVWTNGGVAHTDGVLTITISSPARTLIQVLHFPAGNTEFYLHNAGFFQMDTGATAKVTLNVTGGTGTKVMDIPAQAGRTVFSGRLMP